ncbi:hypothetical protein Rhopal_003149-T1 [Rhodotorula paludigena]|uniref:HNH nuclease domain-containing protein n=1 Tax=Rhodotorula paludigena TaxID=86838 RepID=A0AAV5GKV2_9BASI|nr:hypothetical protein Rhopal_003149-T1 [Rhodotorula paludigena]
MPASTSSEITRSVLPQLHKLVALLEPSHSPWAFDAAADPLVKGRHGWAEATAVPYMQLDHDKKPKKCCAVVGAVPSIRLEAAHIVPANNGDKNFDILIAAGAVPDFAHHLMSSNRITLLYAEQRKSSNLAQTLPLHPQFDQFYARLESQPPTIRIAFSHFSDFETIVRMHPAELLPVTYLTQRNRYEVMRPQIADSGVEPLPPFILPISLNCLIFAMHRRIAQRTLATSELMEYSEPLSQLCGHLVRLWHCRDADESGLHNIIKEVQTLVRSTYVTSAYANFILDPAAHTLADLAVLELPSAPSNAIDSVWTLGKAENDHALAAWLERVACEQGETGQDGTGGDREGLFAGFTVGLEDKAGWVNASAQKVEQAD